MKVKVSQPYADGRYGGLMGEHELPDDLARQLIAAGIAVVVEQPALAPKQKPAPKSEAK